MDEQIEKRLAATLNEYASKVTPDLNQAQHLVRHQLTPPPLNWNESDTRHNQEPITTKNRTQAGPGYKPGKASLTFSTKTPAPGKLQPLALFSLLVAVILILSFLIISVVQPVSTTSNISASQTKVMSQGQASPSAVSATKTNTTGNLYLGPDNTFHVGVDSTQVSAGPSKPVLTTSREANFQILWLVTDSNSTNLGIEISGDKLSFNANNNGISTDDRGIGVLKDELGQTYPVKVRSSIPIPVNNRNLNGATWWCYASSLPPTAQKLSFIPDANLPFTLSENPQTNLVKIKEAGLPQPAVFDSGKNTIKDKEINFTVPYGYFGPARTVLVVRVYPEPNRPTNPGGTGWVSPSYSFPGEVGVKVVDDQGHELLPLANIPFQQSSTTFLGEPSTPAGAQEQTLVLQPLTAGTKNIQVKVNNIAVRTYRQRDNQGKFIQLESSATVPLKKLIDSSVPQTGPEFEFAGFKVQVTQMRATIEQNSGQIVNLQLNYTIAGLRASDSATAIGILFEYYYGDKPVTLNGGGYNGNPGEEQTTYTKFFIESDKNEVQLIVADVAYNLPGNWQITLPIA